MVKKKRRKAKCRTPHLDWNQFIVDWNQLYATGSDVRAACQFFNATHECLAVRLGQLAKLGIYMPRLGGMSGFKNKAWVRGEKRIRKRFGQRPARMLADMASSGMVFRLMPVAAS